MSVIDEDYFSSSKLKIATEKILLIGVFLSRRMFNEKKVILK